MEDDLPAQRKLFTSSGRVVYLLGEGGLATSYLFGEGCVLQLDVGLGVREDRLERLAQVLLVKVLVLSDERTQ